jgi:autoinducer-2 kinase
VDVSVPVVKESTALGCAIAAGVGAGWNSNLQEAAGRLAKVEKRLEPSARNHATYQALYANWLEVYDRALGMVDEGLVRPLWRAVGT